MALCYNTLGKNEPINYKEQFMSWRLIKTRLSTAVRFNLRDIGKE